MRTTRRSSISTTFCRGLAVLLSASLAAPAAGARSECDMTRLAEIEELYFGARFDEAISQLELFLAQEGLSADCTVEGNRLLAHTYIGMDRLGEAREAVRNILRTDCAYQASPSRDHPLFAGMVTDLKPLYQCPPEPSGEAPAPAPANWRRWAIYGGGGALVAGLLIALAGGGGSGGGDDSPAAQELPDLPPLP